MELLKITKTDYTRISKNIKSALEERSVAQREVDKLLAELNSAKKIDSIEIPPDVVTMNSIVKIRIVNKKSEHTFQLVYPKDADPAKDKISIFSPVASALIGRREEDELEWVVPSGLTKLKIEKIIYQPEKSGEFHL